jgi:CheY-like chemotaxis protein
MIDVKGLSALIVDDNAINLRVFSEILNHWGIVSTTVDNGAEAIKALQAMADTGGTFSLILLDAMMPTMDGFMVAKAIRDDKRFEPVTIMMLSSADRPDDFERCQALGINLYVRKPVKHSELWDAIQSALGKTNAKKAISSDITLEKPSQLLTILLAEDNPVNQFMAVVLLKERGHSVHVANNGQEVLDFLQINTYDLILMDVQMPVMDGFQATETIREQEKISGQHMRIIAMTAHALKGDRERCLAAGMDGYIAKPVQEKELLELVENWNMPQSESKNDVSAALDTEAESALDWQEALSRVRGRHQLLAKMMTLFQSQTVELLATMENAIQHQNAELLRISAHTLKSSANSIGAFSFGDLAQQLETIGANAIFAEAQPTLELLKKVNEQLQPAIQQFLTQFQD